MIIYFVILHYQNKEDTINCINSIKNLEKLPNNDYKIIVVDNNSPNHSGKELFEQYKMEQDIDVVILDKNYGFSKANNIGYEMAKKNNADIILVHNNDIIFKDKEFLKKLLNNFEKYNDYDIIIPDVVNLKNYHQNPMREFEMNYLKAIKNCLYKKLISKLLYIPFLNNKIYDYEIARDAKWYEKNYFYNNLEKMDYFVPIGAFIIYINNWIKNENIAFPSSTFMYCEEDFLVKYSKNKKYKMIFDSKLMVMHLEGRSVQTVENDKCKNLSIKYNNQANAIYKYIKFIKRNDF